MGMPALKNQYGNGLVSFRVRVSPPCFVPRNGWCDRLQQNSRAVCSVGFCFHPLVVKAASSGLNTRKSGKNRSAWSRACRGFNQIDTGLGREFERSVVFASAIAGNRRWVTLVADKIVTTTDRTRKPAYITGQTPPETARVLSRHPVPKSLGMSQNRQSNGRPGNVRSCHRNN